MKTQIHPQPGFTLVELLVTISIIALLIALLLPVLNQARYQARIVQCQATLRGVALSMIVYTNDNRDRLPEVVDEWTGTSFVNSPRERSWRMAKSNQYDLRPIYRDYLGATLDDAFKCPLATEWYATRNQDDLALSNYMLYPSNNYRSKHFDYGELPGGYVSPDFGFSVWDTPDLNFGVLASDMAMTRYNVTAMLSGHPAPGGSLGEFTGIINDAVGYDLGTELEAPINFADRDGSVRTYVMSFDTFLDKDWIINLGRGSSSKGMLLPRNLGR